MNFSCLSMRGLFGRKWFRPLIDFDIGDRDPSCASSKVLGGRRFGNTSDPLL